MENEQNQELELDLETEQEGGGNAEAEPKKPELTPEQIRGIKQRQFTRLAKDLGIEMPKSEDKRVVEKTKLDYGELAYLEAKGVSDEDYDFIFAEAKSTGKELKDIMGFKYVQEELKNRKEARVAKDALPTGSKRSGAQARDSVDYWIAKGELPPADQTKLRREVVRAKMKAEEDNNKFSSRPII